ncbi:hypothetical protein [Mobilisporobacter senegalensis]|uniref:hypothetical protein n=1 Tax=Mobilisporobacter senegalensis TaxID=1329262 RepID=UPI001A9B7497|nr:hypothetical protein [Mobilisporobacter senegalensis]
MANQKCQNEYIRRIHKVQEHSRCNQYKLSYGYPWWIINDKEYIYHMRRIESN